MHVRINRNIKPFEVLGIEPTLDRQIIKTAFRALAKENHPDRHPGKEEQFTRRLAEINSAWDELKTPKKCALHFQIAKSLQKPQPSYTPRPSSSQKDNASDFSSPDIWEIIRREMARKFKEDDNIKNYYNNIDKHMIWPDTNNSKFDRRF
tara:strand:+ start:66 stop:515 length:450 start_codon:yes stop_codon:yes gene_type:complete